MGTCIPAVVTGAFQVTMIVMNLMNRDFEKIAPNAILGVIVTFFMLYLCQRGASWVAWGLLILPTTLILSFILLAQIGGFQAKKYPGQRPPEARAQAVAVRDVVKELNKLAPAESCTFDRAKEEDEKRKKAEEAAKKAEEEAKKKTPSCDCPMKECPVKCPCANAPAKPAETKTPCGCVNLKTVQNTI